MKRLLLIIFLCIILISVIWAFIDTPNEYKENKSLVPPEETHGNKVSNLIQRGYVAYNEDYIFLNTSKGIIKVNKYTFEVESITEDKVSSINVVNDDLYYLYNNKIIAINLDNDQKRTVFRNKHSVDIIDAIGDKIFGFKGLSGGYIAYIDSLNNKMYSLINVSSTQSLIGYYEGNYYYFDLSYDGESYICKYDLLSHKAEGLVQVTDRLSSYFLDSNIIYYAYEKQDIKDKQKLNSVWSYNVTTKENNKIADFNKSYKILNIIDDKLILIDEWFREYEAWYIYDFDTKEIITIKDELRCGSVFVTDNYIIALYVSNEKDIYKFYNDEGEYLDIEIEY